METVVLEQHSGTHIIFHSIKPVYRRWSGSQAIYYGRQDQWWYGSILQRIGQVLWERSGLLRIAQGWYGSEWYGMAAGAVWGVAQRMLASIGGDRRTVWIKELGQTVQAKVAVVVNLCLR